MLRVYILKYGVITLLSLAIAIGIAIKFAIPDVSMFQKKYSPRKPWTSYEAKQQESNRRLYYFLGKHYRFVNWFFVISILIVVAWMFFYNLFPMLLDIPFDLKEQYSKIEGIALDDSYGEQKDRYEERFVRLEDRDGAVVRIRTVYTGIYQGNTYLAYYLPNSKIAPYFKLVKEAD